MGNTQGIPASSNDDWVVVPIRRTWFTGLCGKIEIPLDDDKYDSRLVNNPIASQGLSSNGGRERGIIPKHEYNNKIQEFNTKIGLGRMRMLQIFWFCLIIAFVLPQVMLMRFLSQDTEVWIFMVLTYIPLVLLSAYNFRHMKKENEKVKEIFEDWNRFGVEVEWYYGSKHDAARLGFKLPAGSRQGQVDESSGV